MPRLLLPAVFLLSLSGCGETVTSPGTSLSFQTVGVGIYSTYKDQGALVIRDPAIWAQVLPNLDLRTGANGAPGPAPVIDFSRDMAIVVCLGVRGSGGYSVRVDQVTAEGSEIVVKATELTPGRCAATLALTDPLAVVTLSSDSRPVRVEWSQAVAPGC